MWRAGVIGLFLLSVAIYWPSVRGQAVWDDHEILTGRLIAGNRVLASLFEPFLSYYRPLTGASYALDHTIWGNDVAGFHLTNILIHALTAALLAMVGARLFKSQLAGFLSGLLFAVMPAQLAAVAWIGGRTDTLSALFCVLYIGALVLYGTKNKYEWLYAAIGIFFLACLVKEQNLVLIFLAPFVLRVTGAETRSWNRCYLRTRPLIIPAFLFVIIWILKSQPGHHLVGVPMGEWLVRLPASAANYALLLLGISPDPLFTFTIIDYRNAIGVLVGAGALVALIVGTVYAFRSQNGIAVPLAGFVLAYLPVSNVVPIPSLLVGPYRVAVVGVFICLALGYLGSKFKGVPAYAIATVWAFTLFTAMPNWLNEMQFFKTVVAQDPNGFIAREHLAQEYLEISKPSDALTVADTALDWMYGEQDWRAFKGELSPAVRTRISMNVGAGDGPNQIVADILFLRSVALDDLSRGEEAMLSLTEAEHLDPKNADVLASMGDHLLPTDRPRAVIYYERSVEQDPKDWENLRRLAQQRRVDGKDDEAEQLYRKAVNQAPLASIAWIELASLLEKRGAYRGAINALEHAQDGLNFDKEGVAARIKELQTKLPKR